MVPLGTEPEPCQARLDEEEHWQRIIAAVRGKELASVWFEFKSALAPEGKAADRPLSALERSAAGPVLE